MLCGWQITPPRRSTSCPDANGEALLMTDQAFTAVQISDLHLDPMDEAACRRFDHVANAVTDAKPDLIVVSGDLTADGFLYDQFEYARSRLDALGPPLLIIPGNHDVGDKPGEKNELKPEYLQRWNATFGTDRFAEVRGRWRLIGINTQILGADLPQEAAQFDWLDQQLKDAAEQRQNVALFLHTAPYLHAPDEQLTGPSQYWGFHTVPRQELLKRIEHPAVKLVANGHLHWYRATQRDGAMHIWCPSVSFIADDAVFPRGGAVGRFLRYRFDGDQFEHELIKLDLDTPSISLFRRQVELPGREPITMAELVLDFTGTLSKDGQLLPGVADRLTELANRIRITVMTADTFGRAREALADLPVEMRLIETGADKAKLIDELGPGSLVAIGNGRNDLAMVKAAAIGIAVIGPEGAAGELAAAADVVTNHIHDALDLVANPLRLKATLRD